MTLQRGSDEPSDDELDHSSVDSDSHNSYHPRTYPQLCLTEVSGEMKISFDPEGFEVHYNQSDVDGLEAQKFRFKHQKDAENRIFHVNPSRPKVGRTLIEIRNLDWLAKNPQLNEWTAVSTIDLLLDLVELDADCIKQLQDHQYTRQLPQ